MARRKSKRPLFDANRERLNKLGIVERPKRKRKNRARNRSKYYRIGPGEWLREYFECHRKIDDVLAHMGQIVCGQGDKFMSALEELEEAQRALKKLRSQSCPCGEKGKHLVNLCDKCYEAVVL